MPPVRSWQQNLYQKNASSYAETFANGISKHMDFKSFYSDRFSVFRDNHKGNLAYEPITQFQRALSVLDVELICASSPQAKGRVERANETLQDRLVKEMRLLGISNYEQANQYLLAFILDYNRRFAVMPASSLDFHRPLDATLIWTFSSIHDSRRSLQHCKSIMLA